MSKACRIGVALLLAYLGLSVAMAQPGQTLRALRLKLSAADLPSAESILEVHRAEKGEDAEYLQCVAWLARGGALVGDWIAAERYANQAIALAEPKLKSRSDFDSAAEAAYALGTAIDVRSQLIAMQRGKPAAQRYLEKELESRADTPVAFRSRIQRRWNLIGLEGKPAPEIASEDTAGGPPKALRELLGKPVVLFFWAQWCGDCKSQAVALRKVVEKYHGRGVEFIAPTRYYEDDQKQERAKLEQVWREAYPGLQQVPVPISEKVMLRYGASATPTFVFVDRKGIVRLYSPTRMTEERLSAAIDAILR